MNKALILGVAAAALAVPALAQMVDGSGKLWSQTMTRADAEAKAREKFAKNDTDRDGFITREEVAARVEARMGERRGMAFDRLDADKNGSLSREEFSARPNMDRMVERRVERRMDGPGAKDGRREMRVVMMRHGGPGGGHIMMMTDTDKDGRISQAEAVGGALKMFDQTDANKDGTVTAEERRAAMQAWGTRMRGWGGRMRGMTDDMPPPPPPPAG